MRFILFILFIAMPFIELALLIKLGNVLGFWPTIAIVVTTAIIGAYVLQSQGLATMRRLSESISAGEPPIKPVVDGFFLAIAGAFLITPGIVTDAVGCLLLVPPVRGVLARWIFGRIVKSGHINVRTYTSGGGPGGEASGEPHAGPRPRNAPRGSASGPVIDGEFEEVKKK